MAPSAASGNFSLGTHSVPYSEMSGEARALDAMLYNMFKMSVRGTKQQLLTCVSFPSYVQAVIVLTKHLSISRMQRMMAAFAKMDALTFNGDVLAFQTQFLSAKRELDNTKASIAEYTICKLMRAFDGKSKTIQFKIAG